ncbi:MAG: hypothetical protein H7Y00_08285 [Fimbriimonadaceae bacterium]|nr:hypothetical protein [Chitinophagales bacterium]
MRNVIILSSILISFLFTNCTQEKQQNTAVQKINITEDYTLNPAPVNSVARFTESFSNTTDSYFSKQKPSVQKFNIQEDVQSEIICDGGTKIQFPSDAFVYADTKQPVEDKVEISITEYLSNADIIFGGLQTMSGKDMLETGGMIYIEAYSDGRKCAIKDGEHYAIEIPALQNQGDMQLFYGVEEEDNRIDWVTANGNSNLREDNVSNIPQFEGGIVGLYTYLNQNITLPEGAAGVTLKAHKNILVTFTSTGEIIEVKPHPTVKTYIDNQIVDVLKYSPCWEMPIINSNEIRMVQIPFEVNWIRDPNTIPLSLRLKDQAERDNYKAFFNMNNYMMASGKLGWINCDRFINTDEPRVDLFVQLDNTTDMKINLLFNDIRGFITGVKCDNGYVFKNIPANEAATIVALKIEGTEMKLAIHSCITGDIDITDLEFETADNTTIKERLNNLGYMPDFATASL